MIIIPAYNPNEKFTSFLSDLTKAGYNNIIVIDDGSSNETKCYFVDAKEKFGCQIVEHSVNLGQGRAYKTGFNYYLSETKMGGCYENTIGVIQCDCDGQHCIEDINKCADLFWSNPEKFILGVRDFSDKGIPFRSRLGNYCTSFVFKCFCGLNLKDTQTGLKGIPKSFVPILMETLGERFEYASSVLLEAKKREIEILQFPIHTIYINGNETSHFKPLLDSMRIYSLIMKYLMSSLSAFVFDIVLFRVFTVVARWLQIDAYIFMSTYLAKILTCTYSFVINKNLVFKHRDKGISTICRYIIFCVFQATLSAILVNVLVEIVCWNIVLSKIVIDTLLFFISFQVQNRWGFKNVIKN